MNGELDQTDENENKIPDKQDPMSPHSLAPQAQDEEEEKAHTTEEGAQVHQGPAAEEEVHEDTESAQDLVDESEKIIEQANKEDERK